MLNNRLFCLFEMCFEKKESPDLLRKVRGFLVGYYTIARNVRELQPVGIVAQRWINYTIARNVRELQRLGNGIKKCCHYTIARNVRVL